MLLFYFLIRGVGRIFLVVGPGAGAGHHGWRTEKIFKSRKLFQVKYGTKRLRNLAPKIWNSLPLRIKTADNLDILKDLIKTWDGASCKCNICFKHSLIFFCYMYS